MDDSSDEIERCQQIEPHEVEEVVKSKAVMKFSPVQVPTHFNRLECNTNLNLPPSNWLTTSDNTHGLHQALYQSTGFASFRLGHMFPDCVGEVDVVSDAENIKKLLKLPYTSKGAISMVVHKVGNNTLLLDEFDIQRYLLRKADDDWKWLRQFIMEQVIAFGEKDINYCIKDKSREALQKKNLLSKFLYYSLKQQSGKDESTSDENMDTSASSTSSGSKSPPSASLFSPVLPEAKEEVHVPDPKSGQAFNRNVVWTFEDIRMLVGTNFPIFGGKNRPCVSLRLRDKKKPINVLTGIDYWLDNLMCNVPEVVMCYHLDGIVQKYEIIKTEDLPYLENSQFSPQVVRNVAQRILSFLKANATKAGHTYWLFKGRNDDVVKLYDLTTLCKSQTENDEEAEKSANPFTVPVAMLLYKVAQNMKRTVQIKPKAAGNIRALLDNCIKLLSKEKYPQIVTSSHYILSDLYIPAGIDPKSPNFDEHESDDQSVYDEDFIEEEQEPEGSECDESFDSTVDVATLQIGDTIKNFKSHTKQSKPVPLVASIEERCSTSLQHISDGLSCLQYFNAIQEKLFLKESEARAKEEEKQRIIHEEKTPVMAKSMNVIPLPYENLKPKKVEVDEIVKTQTKQKNSKGKRGKIKEINKTRAAAASAASVATVTASEEVAAIPAGPAAPVENVKPNKKNNKNNKTKQQLMENFNNLHFGSWNVHLKLLLLEKACLTYATIAEYHFEANRFGSSLNAIYISYRCQQVVSKYISNLTSQRSCLLGRAGDCLFQMAKHWMNIGEYLSQFNADDNVSRIIKAELNKEVEANTGLAMPTEDEEKMMCLSCKYYEEALECATNEFAVDELLRRLGNVRNELGVKYMYWAQNIISEALEKYNNDALMVKEKVGPIYELYIRKCYDCLRNGIHYFKASCDVVNLGFLFCNMGRYMRMRAHFVLESSTIGMTKRKAFYRQAFDYYERARNVLSCRHVHPELWDMIRWELSTATFTYVKHIQDTSDAAITSYSDVAQEVIHLLNLSLHLCENKDDLQRADMYLYRSALIHKRIASFYYCQMRSYFYEMFTMAKSPAHLCVSHYNEAAKIFNSIKDTEDYLAVQIERISLQEFLAFRAILISAKLKHMKNILDIILQSESIFENTLLSQVPTNGPAAIGVAMPVESNAKPDTEIIDKDIFENRMELFQTRMEVALKTLLKLSLECKDPKKVSDLYKKMYMETLNGKRVSSEQQLTIASKAEYLLKLLKRLNKIYDESC